MRILICVSILLVSLVGCQKESVSNTVTLPEIYQAALSGKTENALKLVEAYEPSEGVEQYQVVSLQGKLLLELGRPRDAIEFLKEAVALNPGVIEDHVALATAFNKLGDEKSAIAVLVDGKQRLPNGRYDAFADITASVVSPDEVRLFLLLAELKLDVSGLESSISILEEGLLRNTGSVELFEKLISSLPNSDAASKRSMYIENVCPHLLAHVSACAR